MPELPQMQALSERIDGWLHGATFEGSEPLGFTGLKTAVPSPDELVGHKLVKVGAPREVRDCCGSTARPSCLHRVPSFAGRSALISSSQPPKRTKPKGSVVRWRFSDNRAVLLRGSSAPNARRGEWMPLHPATRAR